MKHDWGHWVPAPDGTSDRIAETRWCLRCGLEHWRRSKGNGTDAYSFDPGREEKADPAVCPGLPLEPDHRGHDMRPMRTGITYIEGGPVKYHWHCATCRYQWNSIGASRDPVLVLPELKPSDECGVRVAAQVLSS